MLFPSALVLHHRRSKLIFSLCLSASTLILSGRLATAREGPQLKPEATNATVAISFTANFAGAQLLIDNSTYSAPAVLQWLPGTTHTVDLSTPQYLGSTSWTFNQWSDVSGVNNKKHTIVVPSSPATYTATFNPGYQLTTHINPSETGGGVIVVNPTSPNSYYAANLSIGVQALPAKNCAFSAFTGALSSSKPSASLLIKQPTDLSATFTCSGAPGQIPVTVSTSFAGGTVLVDNVEQTSPVTVSWSPGTTHTLNVNTQQQLGATRYLFTKWSNQTGSTAPASQTITAPNSATTYTATFSQRYRLYSSVTPVDGGTLTINPSSSDNYYVAGQKLTLSVTPAKNCLFQQWLGDVTSTSPTATLTMSKNNTAAAQLYCSDVPNGSTRAKAADSFVDSVGVNVHLHDFGMPYADNFPLIQQSLVNLGVRHIRDGLIDTQWQGYYDHLNALGALGIKASFITDVGQSAALLADYPNRVPQALESFEAPNEYDTRGGSNWASTLAAFQKSLYTNVKSNLTTASLPVYGPSLTSEQAYHALGDLSSFMDYGNLHNYFGGHNPGTTGWGANGYGSITWNLAVAKTVDATKPMRTTESGYYSLGGSQQVPETQAGRYVPRLFLEQLNNGIDRTYLYELIDEQPNSSNSENNYGLLRNDGSAKPAYTALASLISLLKDPGAPFRVGGLTYTLSGSTKNVHQALFQKRNGTLYLLLWLEVSSFDANTQQIIAVTPQSVNLHISQSTGTPLLYSLSDSGVLNRTTPVLSDGNLNLVVTDRVSVIVLPRPVN